MLTLTCTSMKQSSNNQINDNLNQSRTILLLTMAYNNQSTDLNTNLVDGRGSDNF